MVDLRLPPRVQTRAQAAKRTLEENQLVVAVVAAVLGYWLIQNGIPEWTLTLLWGTLYGGIPAYLVGLFIVEKMFPDTRREVVELNLSDDNNQVTARSWFVPDGVWRDRARGERPALEPEKGAEAVVTELELMDDLDRIRVEGCNEELADPVSMIARDAKIAEIEDNLTRKAEQLEKLQATLRSEALTIQRENVHAIMSAIEQGTQMNPGAVENAIDGIELDLDLDAERLEKESGTTELSEHEKALRNIDSNVNLGTATDD